MIKSIFIGCFVLLLLCLVFGPTNVGLFFGRLGHHLAIGAFAFGQAMFHACIGG